MSREKRHRKKKHDKDKNHENDNHRSKDRLFTEADGRAADIPYYTMNNYPVSQANPTGEERRIPLGVGKFYKMKIFETVSFDNDSGDRQICQTSQSNPKISSYSQIP